MSKGERKQIKHNVFHWTFELVFKKGKKYRFILKVTETNEKNNVIHNKNSEKIQNDYTRI